MASLVNDDRWMTATSGRWLFVAMVIERWWLGIVGHRNHGVMVARLEGNELSDGFSNNEDDWQQHVGSMEGDHGWRQGE